MTFKKSGSRPLDLECKMRIQELIDSGCNILEVAEKLNVSESTVRKIINDIPISQILRERMEKLIYSGVYLQRNECTRVTKLKKCYEMYRNLGTLQAVANELGLTRERVRQLLVKGTKLKLFNYKAREYPYISLEKILNDYRSCLNKTKVARMNKISTPYLNSLLLAYSIDDEKLKEIRLKLKKEEYIKQYYELQKKYGRELSTTDLYQTHKSRALCSSITRYWGSFANFRADNQIEKPPSCKMTFRERIQPWIDQRVRIATIRRMQDIDTIEDAISDNKVYQLSHIAITTNLDPNRVRNLLGLLVRAGHVEKIGDGAQTKYRLTA